MRLESRVKYADNDDFCEQVKMLSTQGVPLNHLFSLEGLTLTVESVERSMEFYVRKLGLLLEVDATPAFALVRSGGPSNGGTIGLLSATESLKDGAMPGLTSHRRSVHVEFSTDDLDGLYTVLQGRGVEFVHPPHDEPWERSMTALDPDGYSVEFAQGKRGQNTLKANAGS